MDNAKTYRIAAKTSALLLLSRTRTDIEILRQNSLH